MKALVKMVQMVSPKFVELRTEHQAVMDTSTSKCLFLHDTEQLCVDSWSLTMFQLRPSHSDAVQVPATLASSMSPWKREGHLFPPLCRFKASRELRALPKSYSPVLDSSPPAAAHLPHLRAQAAAAAAAASLLRGA